MGKIIEETGAQRKAAWIIGPSFLGQPAERRLPTGGPILTNRPEKVILSAKFFQTEGRRS